MRSPPFGPHAGYQYLGIGLAGQFYERGELVACLIGNIPHCNRSTYSSIQPSGRDRGVSPGNCWLVPYS
jgi:hypothetical protein